MILSILAPVFVSLLRIDEDDYRGTWGLKLSFRNQSMFRKIFPNLYANPYIRQFIRGTMPHTYSLTQLSSCFMFMSLAKTLLNVSDDYFIEMIGFSNIYYQTPNNKKLISHILDRKTPARGLFAVDKLKLCHGLVMVPHYMEHCRGAFSDGLYKIFVYKMYKTIGMTGTDMLDIVAFTINNILKSGEYKYWKHGNRHYTVVTRNEVKSCVIEQNLDRKAISSKLNSFRKCCENFGGQRYDSGEFVKLSNNFNYAWEQFGLTAKLNTLL